MCRDRRGPQKPYQIHVYKSRFLLHDFILQTSIQFYGNTPAMAFNDNLNNMTVCSAIYFLPFMPRGLDEYQQTEDQCTATVHRDQRAKLSRALLFVAEFCLLYLIKSGGVRTLIALHNRRKTKSKSFASCRGRITSNSRVI